MALKSSQPNDDITVAEDLVLNSLASAWNEFIVLTQTHSDDVEEFRHALHCMQHIIATRRMRRIEPDVWAAYACPGNLC